MIEVNLDIYQAMAAAVVVFYVGTFLVRKSKFLQKYCIPAPVVGGLIYAILHCILYMNGIMEITMITTMQSVFMMIFFTSIGYTASFTLIKRGGVAVIKMLIAMSVLCVLQNFLGVGLSKVMNLNPLIGMATGSIPMVGGHGTSASFGPVLETMGLASGTTIAVAAATFGLIAGGLLGGPVGKSLITRHKIRTPKKDSLAQPGDVVDNNDTTVDLSVIDSPEEELIAAIEEETTPELYEELIDNSSFMNAISQILVSIGLGTLIMAFFSKMGLVFPVYIGAMLVAAIIRNVADMTHKIEIYQREAEALGSLSLNIFLAMALMNLKLWQLFDLALPLLALLLAQAILMFIFAYFILFPLMGKNYESAVMASGCCGFGMGATPNAIANMNALTSRFGPAPMAFFVIPLIGSLFIDFVNATIITTILNLL